MLLAAIRPVRQVMVFKRETALNPSHQKYRGHVIAIPNPPAPAIFKATYSTSTDASSGATPATSPQHHSTNSPSTTTFPLPLEDILQHISLVFVNPAQNKQHIHNMARNASAAQVTQTHAPLP
jgi:BRCT domain type II-containing protein